MIVTKPGDNLTIGLVITWILVLPVVLWVFRYLGFLP